MTSKNGREFNSYTSNVEVTYGGIFGGPADTCRRYEPGLRYWTIDGMTVSEEVFMRELRIDFPDMFDEAGNLKS